jgi:hypothetical protein
MTLGMRRSAVLRRLLGDPAPDLLGVIRREDDENSHSDVLRWLLDPRELGSRREQIGAAVAADTPGASGPSAD